VLRGASPEKVAQWIKGRRIDHVERRGKHLLVALEGDRAIHIHLGMTGRFVLRRAAVDDVSHARLTLELDDGRMIVLSDPRMFGVVEIGRTTQLRAKLADSLGPDPLLERVGGTELCAILAKTRRPVKVALMDQRSLAGIGNIQATEALWRARIHPDVPARNLDRVAASRLARGMMRSIEAEITALQGSGDADLEYLQDAGSANPFLVYGREGELCPRCKSARIVRKEQAGRSTFFCPTCQVRTGTKARGGRPC
jgi:formamidopyrimidine-DNA glycosylase